MSETFNYVVMFHNGNVKTGITKNPFTRLQNYIQESLRSNIRVTGYEITPPTDSHTARHIEKNLCDQYASQKISGLKEWFTSDGWNDVEPLSKKICASMAVACVMNDRTGLLVDFSNSPYCTMIKHAAYLGKRGATFNAVKAASASRKNVIYKKFLNAYKKRQADREFLLSHEGLSPAMWALKQARAKSSTEVAA